jgi:D-methionine transport system ATP-binding protein
MIALRRKAGWLPADPALMAGLTLEENIALPLAASGAKKEEIANRVRDLLKLTGLEGLNRAYPASVTYEQQKRVSLARALISGPKVLLCLEPAQGLAPAAEDEYLDLLDRLHTDLKLTVLLSTTDLHVIKRLCSLAAILKDGKIVEQDDAYTLFSMPKHPFTREFLAQQLSFGLPQEVKDHAIGTIVLIEYMGDPANEPVLYETAQSFGAEFNILQGHIEYIGGKPLGRMYVSFNAEPALMVSVLNYLKSHTYRAEVVKDV